MCYGANPKLLNFKTTLLRMKKLLLLAVLFLLAGKLQAQELILPKPINKNDKLTHSYTVQSQKYADKAKEIATKMERLIQAKQLDLNHCSDLDPIFADVVFQLNEPDQMVVQDQILKFKTTDEAAKKGAKLLETLFYSGMRPRYSTIFNGGTEGYVEYRIPSAVVLPNGRIIAFIEGRSIHRDQAENDIVAKYSDDQGISWSKPIIVAADGEASLNNPCVVYVEENNRILLMYQRFPPKSTEGSAPVGVDGENIMRAFIVSSDDNGLSWSTPKDITLQVKHREANSVCSGPGVGIRVNSGPDKGRIIMPFNGNGSTRWINYIVYSDDLGENWKMAPGESGYGTNESQIVQVGDTEFMFNARSHRYPADTTYRSPDGWNPWNFNKVTRNRAHIPVTMSGDQTQWHTTRVMENQPDPTCQGSIIRIGKLGDGKPSCLLLSNPASQHTHIFPDRAYAQTPPMRINGTVKASYDEGESWKYAKRIYGDRFTEYQYSVLVDLGNGKIGCIFEAHPEVRFAVFDMKWLSGGQQSK